LEKVYALRAVAFGVPGPDLIETSNLLA
jgi:hypothetical protein